MVFHSKSILGYLIKTIIFIYLAAAIAVPRRVKLQTVSMIINHVFDETKHDCYDI